MYQIGTNDLSKEEDRLGKCHINILKLVCVWAAVYWDIKDKRSRYLESSRSYMSRKFKQIVIRRKLGTSRTCQTSLGNFGISLNDISFGDVLLSFWFLYTAQF